MEWTESTQSEHQATVLQAQNVSETLVAGLPVADP